MALRKATQIVNEDTPHPEEGSERSQKYPRRMSMMGWFVGETELPNDTPLQINEYYLLAYDDDTYLAYKSNVGCPAEYLINYLNRTIYLNAVKKVKAIHKCNTRLRNID